MTDYERGYEQGKADAAKKMHPEMRKMWEDYFDKCFKEYDKHLRQWVGLTDDDYETLSQYAFVEVIEKVEALLKEKNNG